MFEGAAELGRSLPRSTLQLGAPQKKQKPSPNENGSPKAPVFWLPVVAG